MLTVPILTQTIWEISLKTIEVRVLYLCAATAVGARAFAISLERLSNLDDALAQPNLHAIGPKKMPR